MKANTHQDSTETLRSLSLTTLTTLSSNCPEAHDGEYEEARLALLELDAWEAARQDEEDHALWMEAQAELDAEARMERDAEEYPF